MPVKRSKEDRHSCLPSIRRRTGIPACQAIEGRQVFLPVESPGDRPECPSSSSIKGPYDEVPTLVFPLGHGRFGRGRIFGRFFRPPSIARPTTRLATAPAATSRLREQDIYIPYEKLRQVFEKQGRGVFLPYEQFQELWRAAREKTQPAAEPKPPAGGLITDITSAATVEKDVVRVKAAVRIEILTEGWHSIPLRLADAGVIAATLSGKPARIIGDATHGYQLLVEKKGKEPETVELRLEYAKAIARMPGLNSVSFESPQSPVSRWRIVIPQSGREGEPPAADCRYGSTAREKEGRGRRQEGRTRRSCWRSSARCRWCGSIGRPSPRAPRA